MGRWAKCIVISAVLVIAGSVLVPVVLLVRFANKSGLVRNEIARIRAEGAPVSTADLAGKPVPDSQNAALLYEKALKNLDTEPARQDQQFIRGFLDPSERLRDPQSWSQLRAIVLRYSDALELARRAAAMAKCRFRPEAGRPRDYMSRQYGFARSLPRLAWAEAVIRAKEGRTDGALESVELIFLMGESMSADQTSEGARRRYGVIATGTDALLDVARFGGIDEPGARRLADRLARIDLRDCATRALEGERARGISLFSDMRKGGIRSGYSDSDSDNPIDKAHGILPSGWALNNDEVCYLRDIRQQIEIANSSYREIKPSEGIDTAMPRYSLYAPWTASMGARFVLARDQAVARLGGDRIVLGLAAYRSRFGSYPASLDELRTKLDWPVPLDPFSGKAFVYRRQAKGFVLYSIGGDLKDNNGTPWSGRQGGPMWRRGGIVQDPDEHGDYVWKL
jgi:hypothetical protein